MQNARNSLCRKYWIIFMRKQWIFLIIAENKFYECSKHIWIYNKHDVQRENFINGNIFYQCRKIDSIIVKFKHEKTFRFGFQI